MQRDLSYYDILATTIAFIYVYANANLFYLVCLSLEGHKNKYLKFYFNIKKCGLMLYHGC